MYTEIEGNPVEVCVVLLSPSSLARTVIPRVTSEDITATGENSLSLP